MPLEHPALVGRERARLLEDLVRNRDLAEIVQPARELDQLALVDVAAHSRGNSGCEQADGLRVSSAGRISRVNRSGEAHRCLQPRGAVGRRVCDEGAHSRSVGGTHVDAAGRVPLGVVESLVGAIDEASGRLLVTGIGRNSRGHLDRLVEAYLQGDIDQHELDEQPCLFRLDIGQEQRELVAPEPERLTARSEARADGREHEVADRVPMTVVDVLEVVDVEEADADRRAALRRRHLVVEALVEPAAIAHARERIGDGGPHGLECAQLRALVEVEGDERAEERSDEER
jgi:hypothetical protein